MASTFVCSITPLDAAGELDEAGARAHFERMAAAGVGIYAGGSSPGEQYALRPEEVERLLCIAVEAAAGRVPVRAMNVEPRSARQMCEMIRVAERCGVDALQIYSLDVGHGGRPGDAAGDYARLMRLYTTRPDDAGATARWIKAALDRLGLPGGPVREPALPLPPPEVARIAARLDELGLDALL